jgi:hypothetical protein
MSFQNYIKIKDKCAIYYLGSAYEYIIQLISLMPYIKETLSGLQIDVFCKDEIASVIGAKFISVFQETKYDYGYILELTHDLDYHPVEKILKECGIKYGAVDVPSIDGNILCSICPESLFNSMALTSIQVNKAKEHAQKAGYTLTNDSFNAGWIIGPENYALFLAASRGLKTSLIPTGLGTNLYKKMFPSGEILNL